MNSSDTKSPLEQIEATTGSEGELRELVEIELDNFVLWTDDTPSSNEPTELGYFFRGFPNGEIIMKRLVDDVTA